jgi:hypothetical protein
MERQVALLILVLITMVWSASGAPPVAWADNNVESRQEVKADGGSLTRFERCQTGSNILTGEKILALVMNRESNDFSVSGYTDYSEKISARVTINSRRLPTPRDGP